MRVNKLNLKTTSYDASYKFIGKERDTETSFDYFGARYYSNTWAIWLSVDPLANKYPSLSPYNYCAGNPIKYLDPNGMDWEDADGNKIKDHSKIKVYIFYDPRSFGNQSEQMYKDAVAIYGKGSVAMSNVTTEKEFMQDWGDMASPDIREVNLNYHGNNQTVILNSDPEQYITATGNGTTTFSDKPDNTNVQNLSIPIGNISNARLNLNTCRSNSRTQHPLKGSGQTLMEAFHSTFNFQTVRGTSAGVSYNRILKKPEPQFIWQSWDYMGKIPVLPKSSLDVSNSVYYRTGGMK